MNQTIIGKQAYDPDRLVFVMCLFACPFVLFGSPQSFETMGHLILEAGSRFGLF